MRKRVGDTLVEVTLAVGIFSMVAIAVVSVISGSTSSAQSALETTVTREAIDAQAEALRFIHSSYIAASAGNITDENKYKTLWDDIVKGANENETEEYYPSTCAEALNQEKLKERYAFVIDIRNLISNPLIKDVSKIREATTYPRLVYANKNFSEESLLDVATETSATLQQAEGMTFQQAEGIYVVAVQDKNTTNLADGGVVYTTSGYYDFYIRTCWYGPGADTPSTISTVIRLYDPSAVRTSTASASEFTIKYNANGGTGSMEPTITKFGKRTILSENKFVNPGKIFVGWNSRPDGTGIERKIGQNTYTPAIAGVNEITFYAQWQEPGTIIAFNANGGSGDMKPQTISFGSPSALSLNGFSRSNYVFDGWKDQYGNSYADGAIYTSNSQDGIENITLYAQWRAPYTTTIRFYSNGGTGAMSAQIINGGSTARINSNTFTRPGASFTEWNKNQYGTSTSYGPSATITASSTKNETIYLYAQWKSDYYMQDISLSQCRELASDQELFVTDRRDNKGYLIRYSNNACWMTQNLRTSGTISAADSNFASPSTWALNTKDGDSWTGARSYSWNTYADYNFCAATAGYACNKYSYYEGTNDICPTNWRMPNYGEASSVLNNDNILRKTSTSAFWVNRDLGNANDSSLGQLHVVVGYQDGKFNFNYDGKVYSGGMYWGYSRDNEFGVRCIHR